MKLPRVPGHKDLTRHLIRIAPLAAAALFLVHLAAGDPPDDASPEQAEALEEPLDKLGDTEGAELGDTEGAEPEPEDEAEPPEEPPDRAAEDSPESAVQWTMEQESYPPGLSHVVGITSRTCDGPVTIRVLRDGKPATGETVDFRIVGMPSKSEGTELSAPSAVTDAEGRTRVKITLGNEKGDYLVAAYHQGSVREAEPVVTLVKAMTPGWLAFLVFGLFGGLGLFLYGMTIAGDHLQKVAGNQMRILLRKLTRNRFMGMGVGTVVSAVLQSSSAASVMIVGFVSATMMTLTQAIAVVIGTKVGVTITIQLIAFNISQYALLIVGTGAALIIVSGKREKMKHIGAIVLGFGLIFFGLSIMSESMKPLRGMAEFAGLLVKFGANPGLGILVGAAFTGIIQSAVATTAMCMALASQGLLPLPGALALAIGSSIGTCATALLASFGATRDGLRLAVCHLIFSAAAALLFWPFIGPFSSLIHSFTAMIGSDSISREIAMGFMFYSIITALFFVPFVGPLEKITRLIVPASKAEEPFGPRYINDQALGVPVMALEQAQKEVERMAEFLGENLKAAGPALIEGDKNKLAELTQENEKLTILEKAIRPFLAKVAQKGLSKDTAAQERALIYITEHINSAGSLLTREVLAAGSKLASSGAKLSDEDAKEIERFHGKMVDKFNNVLKAISTQHRAAAERVLQLSFKERQLERKLRDSHLTRLQAGSEDTLKSSADYLSILAGLASVGGKLDNAAEEIIREM